MARLGEAFWPGVVGCISCTYTVSHGITPGVAALEVPEQSLTALKTFGTLTITDGVGLVRLLRARVVGVQWNPGPPRTITLLISDRRWCWRYGRISGRYNQTDPYPDLDRIPYGEFWTTGGPYLPGTERTAAQLIGGCALAMNEPGFLCNPAPVTRIPVQWDNEIPAQALQSLCDQIGYRVVFQPQQDRLLLAPQGFGGLLPDNLPFTTNAPGATAPTRPNVISVVAGDTIYQDHLPLEPVGLEADGTIRKLDDLSYKPADGWDRSVPPYFSGITGGKDLTQAEAVELAKRHVYRTFRVKMTDLVTAENGYIEVGGYGKVYDRKQFVLQDKLYGLTKGISGEYPTSPCWLTGAIFYQKVAGVGLGEQHTVDFAGNTTVENRLPVKVTGVDTARGLVYTDQYCFKMSGQSPERRCIAPDLAIKTAFTLRNLNTFANEQFEYAGLNPAGVDLGCPPEFVRRADLARIVSTTRKVKDGYSFVELLTNDEDIVPEMLRTLDHANAKYGLDVSLDRTYAGVYPFNPDGAISQVTWSVGGGQPATTRVSRNSEHAFQLPTYPERRQRERVLNLAAALERRDAGKLAADGKPLQGEQ